jgi:hypothetical protein
MLFDIFCFFFRNLLHQRYYIRLQYIHLISTNIIFYVVYGLERQILNHHSYWCFQYVVFNPLSDELYIFILL